MHGFRTNKLDRPTQPYFIYIDGDGDGIKAATQEDKGHTFIAMTTDGTAYVDIDDIPTFIEHLKTLHAHAANR